VSLKIKLINETDLMEIFSTLAAPVASRMGKSIKMKNVKVSKANTTRSSKIRSFLLKMVKNIR